MHIVFKRGLVGMILFLISSQVFGQDLQISGVVTEAGTEYTIPGATIQVKGTTNGTVADFDGNYKFTVSDAATTLLVSFVGYETAEIEIAGQSVINVALAVSLTQLSEVVVIGYEGKLDNYEGICW